MRIRVGLLLAAALAARAETDDPVPSVRIRVAASRGEITPQSKGGGGFQRTFRFTAVPGAALHWIRQVLAVRGTVFDEDGRTKEVHLDVIEYYRVKASGKTIQHDSHYSQFPEYRSGDLEIRSTLTYGRLRAFKRGDTILGKSFVLRGATDAAGRHVPMRTRTTRRIIPAEKGKRVAFDRDRASIPTRYAYRVRWDGASRTRPSGTMERGTWWMELPRRPGRTAAADRRRKPIPRLRNGR